MPLGTDDAMKLLAGLGALITTVWGVIKARQAAVRDARASVVADYQGLIKGMRDELDRLQKRVKALEDERDGLEHRLDEALVSAAELARMVRENTRLAADNDSLRRQIEGMQRQLYGKEATHD